MSCNLMKASLLPLQLTSGPRAMSEAYGGSMPEPLAHAHTQTYVNTVSDHFTLNATSEDPPAQCMATTAHPHFRLLQPSEEHN